MIYGDIINRFPNEIICAILDNLGGIDQFHATKVCKLWRNIIHKTRYKLKNIDISAAVHKQDIIQLNYCQFKLFEINYGFITSCTIDDQLMMTYFIEYIQNVALTVRQRNYNIINENFSLIASVIHNMICSGLFVIYYKSYLDTLPILNYITNLSNNLYLPYRVIGAYWGGHLDIVQLLEGELHIYVDDDIDNEEFVSIIIICGIYGAIYNNHLHIIQYCLLKYPQESQVVIYRKKKNIQISLSIRHLFAEFLRKKDIDSTLYNSPQTYLARKNLDYGGMALADFCYEDNWNVIRQNLNWNDKEKKHAILYCQQAGKVNILCYFAENNICSHNDLLIGLCRLGVCPSYISSNDEIRQTYLEAAAAGNQLQLFKQLPKPTNINWTQIVINSIAPDNGNQYSLTPDTGNQYSLSGANDIISSPLVTKNRHVFNWIRDHLTSDIVQQFWSGYFRAGIYLDDDEIILCASNYIRNNITVNSANLIDDIVRNALDHGYYNHIFIYISDIVKSSDIFDITRQSILFPRRLYNFIMKYKQY